MAPGETKRNVTIKDVALAAGVSASTVSHAFSGRRRISEQTRDHIFVISKQLGYIPNAHARRLRLGSSGMLGLFLRPRYAFAGAPDTAETFNRLTGSMAVECLRRDLGLVYVPAVGHDGHNVVPMDGCVVGHPYENDDAVRFLEQAGIPFVLIDPDPARDDIPWVVGINYEPGMRRILELASGGQRRKVVLLPGSERNAWNLSAERVYRKWCEQVGQEPEIHVMSESLKGDALQAYVTQIFDELEPPVGLVFATSDSAPAFIAQAKNRGWRIPQELSLAALTDTEHTRSAHPPITALDLSHEVLASHAVPLLLERIAGEAPPEHPILIEPVVNRRASTI